MWSKKSIFARPILNIDLLSPIYGVVFSQKHTKGIYFYEFLYLPKYCHDQNTSSLGFLLAGLVYKVWTTTRRTPHLHSIVSSSDRLSALATVARGLVEPLCLPDSIWGR